MATPTGRTLVAQILAGAKGKLHWKRKKSIASHLQQDAARITAPAVGARRARPAAKVCTATSASSPRTGKEGEATATFHVGWELVGRAR